ncbi:MAG: mechanosensitive ion channel family protein [Desulfobacterales bacterium]
MYSKKLKVIVWVGLLTFAFVSAAWSQNPMMLKTGDKQANTESAENLSLPKHLDEKNIDPIIAGLSDEQVRSLLISELKTKAQQEATVVAKPEGIVGFIEKIKNMISLLQARVEYIRSGGSAAPQDMAAIYTLLGKGERGTKSVASVIVSVAAVLAGSLLIEWLFVLYTAAGRRRITSSVPTGWISKIGALSMRALLDFAAIIIFIVAALAIFFLFLDRTANQRILLAAYVAGLVFFQCTYLALRLFLAPRTPALRFLPFSDETALFLHHWLMALTFIICLGNVTIGVIHIAGATELTVIKASLVVVLIAGGMIIWMILQKRREAATSFSQGLSESSLRYRLAQKWHHFAIFAVLLVLASSIFSRILGTGSGQAALTLLMVLLYFMLDWILRLILEAALGTVKQSQEQPVIAEAASDGPEDDIEAGAAPSPVGEASDKKSYLGWRLDLDRMKGPLRAALRLSLAVLLFFWVLDIWNVDLPIGEAVVKTLIKILAVVLICYVAWGVINAAIMRRLRQEVPEGEDEEAEEGGAGGSRIATLLLLLRKFMLVVIIVMASLIVLSALGVDIGPLIAGAGVFGLAIGFGAQTLVKDIISGVFFLMDDAFRVGDYLEVSGTKGTVEHISLRSLRLRNPRGMVYFVPFGDMKMVTNLSRDYVIMKLDFRVRYDADIEKIRKVIKKKVYQKITENPELGPKLLEPIKSQGVREMDDSAMIMRVKYKTKPGDQFAIRKEVYRLMQEAFKEEGIEFAHRNVTVYMPPEPGSKVSAQAPGENQHDGAKANGEIQRQAAAGAALAAIQAEEEAEKAKQKPEK